MSWAPHHRSPEQTAILRAAVERVRAADRPVAVLDLDGCLLDNRPRQVAIVHAFAARTGADALCRVDTSHFQDWDLGATLRRAGLRDEEIEPILPSLTRFWFRCFFDPAWARGDLAVPGAARFARRLLDAGARLVYLTAREEHMGRVTREVMARFAFPLVDGETFLWFRPDLSEPDVAYKRRRVRLLPRLGRTVLLADNEPCIVNAYRELFPEALVLFVDTDHSPRPDRPHPAIPRVRNFLADWQEG